MIKSVYTVFAGKVKPYVVWYNGRPFTFNANSIDKYYWAAVSESGMLSLFEKEPHIMEPEKRWSSGLPYSSIDIAIVNLDDAVNWKETLKAIAVEECPPLQELFEFSFYNG